MMIGLGRGGIAFAQGTRSDNYRQGTNPQAANPNAGIGEGKTFTKSNASAAGMNQGLQSQMITNEQLLGKEVFDKNGEEIGEVEQLVINKDDGKLAHMVIAIGGVMGMGETRYVIPWEKVSVTPENSINLDIDKQTLANAPKVEGLNADELNDPNWMQSNYKYFQASPFWDNRQKQESL